MNEQSKEGIDGIPDDIYQHLMRMLKQHERIVIDQYKTNICKCQPCPI